VVTFSCPVYFFSLPKRVYLALTELDQADLRRQVEFLCIQPELDGITKTFYAGNPERYLYEDDGWRIVYRVEYRSLGLIEIWAIERVVRGEN
jgi:hypothetical protein